MDYFSNAEKLESLNELPQREQQGGGTTFPRTCFNGLNALAGVGMLSISYAFSQGGWLCLMLLSLVAVICWYTGLLLRRFMEVHPLIKTYPGIGEYAFGHKGRAIVSIFMYVELYLVALEFLILEGDNLDKMFPNMEFKVAGLKIGGKKTFVLLTSLTVLLTTWLMSLGVLAYVSAGGWTEWDSMKEVLLNWKGLPTAISMIAFSYSGHAIFPTLSSSMKDRSQFSKVLLVCFITSTINYGSMAVLGYVMYGEHLKS
ncbi:hypothetical protein CRYUN_Cryun04dG0202300 [Craigia yunnanensis]